MSNSATGRLVLTDDPQHLISLDNYTVVARHTSAIIPTKLAETKTDTDGRFTLRYEKDFEPIQQTFGPRTIEFTISDRVAHRQIKLIVKTDDGSSDTLEFGEIELTKADISGWLVTLGSGQASPPVTRNNAVRPLVDNVVAWKRVSEVLRGATESINLMQLFFDVPSHFDTNPVREHPEIVLSFAPPELTASALRKVVAGDSRPERELLAALDRDLGIDIRIMVNQPAIDRHAIIAGGILLPAVGLLLVPIVGGLLQVLGFQTSLDELERYFATTLLAPHQIQGAKSTPFAVTHAKMVFVDEKTVVSVASPFRQDFYGDPRHMIDDPRRGDAGSLPLHDVSIAVTGPAVAHMHDTFRLLWNIAVDHDPNQTLDPIDPPPPEQTNPDPPDTLASIQVVRTLPSDLDGAPPEGEKGVLEAYLRAIAKAESFVYIEDQYFTEEEIASALVRALTDPLRPHLNVILLVNIDMDIPGYLRVQRKLIAKIRNEMKANNPSSENLTRFGAYTRWTHEPAAPPGRPFARIAPTHLHTKAAVVDDLWATVGSANVDGASLDFSQFLHAIQGGDTRNTEVNVVLLSGIEGQPHAPAVDLLRRQLFAEHLGFFGADGLPDPNAPQLQTPPPQGWNFLWSLRAALNFTALKASPPAAPVDSHILPWPDVDEKLNHPREHLAAVLGKKQFNLGLDPLEGTRRFKFFEGEWRDKAPKVDPITVERES